MENQADLASAFPRPPSFYMHFTEENLAAAAAARGADDAATAAALPPDSPLQYLIPPPPLKDERTYNSLGAVWNTREVLSSLAELGIPRLYSTLPETDQPANRVVELKRLTRSLLVKYLELVGVMGIAPEQFTDRVEDIRVILINFHHLLNEYRPHQARESLVMLMEEHLERKSAEIGRLKDACAHIETVLSSLGTGAPGAGGPAAAGARAAAASASPAPAPAPGPRERDRAAWQAIAGL
ncbi:MED7 protein-domain-containing protein [Dipodascopsis tothii]|uniref:MED7 protein-domain-containing protein n=1 Tax=Dipodascopsis tothii TaxID=44089 RepID=UPI0034CD152E